MQDRTDFENTTLVVIELNMSTTEHDIASFTNFALQKIEAGESDLSIDELFDQWRIENPSDEMYAENVTAVQASIRDFKAGERGTFAGEHSAQLRRTRPRKPGGCDGKKNQSPISFR